MSMADVNLLEKSRITVEDDGKAFRIRGIVIPFEAILHIESARRPRAARPRSPRGARCAQ